MEFPEGLEGLRKNLLCGRGMDVFWNQSLYFETSLYNSTFYSNTQLQAAEARINEANAGLRDNVGLDAPMEEVFSETQRYGRVARYELRPSHFGQDVTSVSGRNNSRRANDFRMVRKPKLNVLFYAQIYKLLVLSVSGISLKFSVGGQLVLRCG